MRRSLAALIMSGVILAASVAAAMAVGEERTSAGLIPSGLSTGDTFTGFGSYKGDPIEWMVLEEDEDSLLIISTESIEIQYYNPVRIDVTWETCYLREWLNTEFIETAFTDEERAVILTSEVKQCVNTEYDTDPGEDTSDRIYVLNIAEALYYFRDDGERISNYHGIDPYWWWLRSPGSMNSYAARVRSDGTVDLRGYIVDNRHAGSGVRPVMRVEK